MSLLGSLKKWISGAPEPGVAPSPAAPPPPAVDYDDPRIPESAKERVTRILASLGEVEELMQRERVAPANQAEIRQMRAEHLPKLVASYIEIPPAHRAEIFRKTGQSASFILDQSLDTIQARVDAILRDLAQHDLDAFTNNAAFIGRRYTEQDPFG